MLKTVLFVLMLLSVSPQQDQKSDRVVHWDSRIHQYSIAKATTLMPGFLQRQILKHRTEILRGCVDALKDLPPDNELPVFVRNEFANLVKAFENKSKFSELCYRLGRLSALTTELGGTIRATPDGRKDELNNFIVSRLQDFPLAVSHLGEKNLAEGELNAFIAELVNRNQRRGNRLAELVATSSPASWHNERSQVYGQSQLVYNDMVVDTSRIWLHLWQTVGGTLETAPYFDK